MPLPLAAAVLLAFAAAFAPLAGHAAAPLPEAAATPPMGEREARHLLARTGFGPTRAEVGAYAGLTRREAVDRLLRETRSEPVTPTPTWAAETWSLRPARGDAATPEERRAFVQEQVARGLEMRAWWIGEMLATPSPLTERMTLFWHNHFVSSQQKVRVARLLLAQNATLRRQAIGNFGTLLHAIARDPAMVLYLDNAQNRRGAPNENFAREVMELFTLGQGHYGEQDIKEAARAFTGYGLQRDTGEFVFRPRLHDDGEKTVFGHSGRYDGDAVLDLILARPETARFIVGKLWREFVAPEPDAAEVERIARAFRGADYDLKVALRELLLAPAFWDDANRGTLVKSPVELVVGTLRQLELAPREALPFALATAGMGQNLFSPPNVRGWPGGEAWINSQTLLARKQFLDRLARGPAAGPAAGPATMPALQVADLPQDRLPASRLARAALRPQGVTEEDRARAARLARDVDRAIVGLGFDPARFVARCDGGTPDAKLGSATRLLLALEPQLPAPPDADPATALRAALLDPAYQLK